MDTVNKRYLTENYVLFRLSHMIRHMMCSLHTTYCWHQNLGAVYDLIGLRHMGDMLLQVNMPCGLNRKQDVLVWITGAEEKYNAQFLLYRFRMW